MAEVDRQIERLVEAAKRAIVRRLAIIGEMCVNKARSLPGPSLTVFWDSEKGQPLRSIPKHTPGYIDWTANLRSSIGYVIVVDGEIAKMSTFEPVKGMDGDGTQGAQEGKAFAERLVAEYPHGIVLIVVAGMKYAEYVQRKGYDVTVSAELLAEQLLEQFGIKSKTKPIDGSKDSQRDTG